MSESECKTSLLKPEENSKQSERVEKRTEADNDADDDDDDDDEDDDDDDGPDDDEHDWWASDSGSSTGSYYSDSKSSIVEWESVIEPNGEVFYIETLIDNSTESEKLENEQTESPPPELTRRRSTRAGKLMRLLRRRESKRYSMRNKKSLHSIIHENEERNNQKKDGNKEVTFRDFQAGEIRQVTLWMDPEKRHTLGRRATLCEAYLGITPGVFSDKIRIMVAGFIPDGEAMKNKNIKIGDWLRSINSREVTLQNLEYVLSGISSPTNVKLELQRVAGVEVTEKKSPTYFAKQSMLVNQLMNKEESKRLMEYLLDYPLGMIYLQTSGLSENGPELQGVVYNFPRCESRQRNHSILCNARGAFITLNHMLSGMIGPQPISTTIMTSKELVHIIYTPRDMEELFLIAVPDKCCTLQESIKLSEDIIRTLEFRYKTLSKCFSNKENHESLDHFFFLIAIRLLSIKSDAADYFSELNLALKNELMDTCEFQNILPAVQSIRLSIDAQIQIDAALNEMEAMDYRDWNEDPMDCQRLYTILGSCYYHKSYLLGSHLPHEDLIQVHSFLRQIGLLNLINREAVRSLVMWRQVFPFSCQHFYKSHDTDKGFVPFVPFGKWFLLVVGYGHDLLAVLLESAGCTAKHNENDGPDIFYVEEAQETLKHIQKIGISTLVEKWIVANAKPEITNVDGCSTVKSTSTSLTDNILGLIKSSESPSTLSKATGASSVAIKKTPEVSSILKRRSPEENATSILGSVYSLQTSEDSMSQGTGAISEISDEAAPILGRRAFREKSSLAKHSDGDEASDSDIDDIYRNDSQTGTMDISDIRDNLLHQAEYIIPKKITSGEKNCLLYYVHLDTLEGILLSPTNAYPQVIESKNSKILNTFNKCANVIHKLLQNTVRFKKILSQDIDKTVINKSLIAIKEHGVSFEHEDILFWVIGRLYSSTPYPKELYVCYRDTVPQNLVEMAFRLNAI